MTAIVAGCYYNGLSIIQDLGQRDVDIYAVDSFRNVGTTSRYATYRRCPNPKRDEAGVVSNLLEFGETFDERPVLIPTSDHWASAIAAGRSQLSRYFRPCVADSETVDLLLNKREFGAWADGRGYSVPRTWGAESVRSVSTDRFPIAVKLRDTRRLSSTNPGSGGRPLTQRASTDLATPIERLAGAQGRPKRPFRLKLLGDRSELERFLDDHGENAHDFVFQEFVPGLSNEMFTVGIYANRGTVKGVFTGRKLRGYPADVGDCKLGQAQSVPEQLVSSVESICKELEYHGIAEFEFKRDPNTGEFALIEVNPRSWSWIGITPACGASLPWVAYRDLTGMADVKYVESTVPDGSVKWVKALEDISNCLYLYRKTYPSWACGLREWQRSIRAERLVVQDLSVTDPLPSAYSVGLLVRRAIKQLQGDRKA